MSYGARGGHGYGNQHRTAKSFQASRSKRAKTMDALKRAPIAKDDFQWMKNPSHYDLEGIDTPRARKSKAKERTPEEVKAEFIKRFGQGKESNGAILSEDVTAGFLTKLEGPWAKNFEGAETFETVDITPKIRGNFAKDRLNDNPYVEVKDAIFAKKSIRKALLTLDTSRPLKFIVSKDFSDTMTKLQDISANRLLQIRDYKGNMVVISPRIEEKDGSTYKDLTSPLKKLIS